MTRKEEIIQAAKQKEKELCFSQIVKEAKGVNSAYGIGFLEGAEWADSNPSYDIIRYDSITNIRIMLVDKFCKLVKQNQGKTIDEVPETRKAFDMVDLFDKLCNDIGFVYDDNENKYKFNIK